VDHVTYDILSMAIVDLVYSVSPTTHKLSVATGIMQSTALFEFCSSLRVAILRCF